MGLPIERSWLEKARYDSEYGVFVPGWIRPPQDVAIR
jgi:hypothetical protein